MHRISLLAIVMAICLPLEHLQSQENDFKSFDVTSIYNQLESAEAASGTITLAPSWWDQHVKVSQRREMAPLAMDINSLMYLALMHSNQIEIASTEPLIRETAITEADSDFDWIKYMDTAWNDQSNPTSTILEAGGNARRLDEQTYQIVGGLRRTTRSGAQVDLSQRFGWQDSNSTFFTPPEQATAELALSFNQPLMRGKGYAYNTSLVVLAQLETCAAEGDFRAVLQDHLMEITRAYWLLYQERSSLAQQVRLFLNTQDIVQILNVRQQIDAHRTQLITASSALESRRADLIRARTAVINAETRLRALINADQLGNSDQVELVPSEGPTLEYFPTDLMTQIETAVQNRPEAYSAMQQVKAGSQRLGIARHEMLPLLNFVAEGYVNGLQGQSNIGQAWVDQFGRGRPSYSVGFQYEMPIGNRLARSRLCRRQVEMRRLQTEYDQALVAIQTEVDIALRELRTAYQEIAAKSRALLAAEADAETIRVRWSSMIDGNGTSALNLESLLAAQERVTQAEHEYSRSLVTYSLAIINLKKANGTLLQSKNVVIGQTCDECSGPRKVLDMAAPADGQMHPSMQSAPAMPPGPVDEVPIVPAGR